MILCSACHHWSFGAQAFVQIADHVGHIALCKLDFPTCIFTWLIPQFQLHACTTAHFGKTVFLLFAGLIVSSHRVSQLATILNIPPQCAWAQKQCASAQKRAHKAAHPLKDRCGVHLQNMHELALGSLLAQWKMITKRLKVEVRVISRNSIQAVLAVLAATVCVLYPCTLPV